jgi:hypothetical protein
MSVLNRDNRLTVRMIAEELGLAKTVVHEIVTQELMMRKVCAKLVPKNLSTRQADSPQDRQTVHKTGRQSTRQADSSHHTQ